MSGVVGYEGVDADFSLGHVAVCGKPSQVVEFVYGKEIVIGCGVERHADVFRCKEFLFFGVVSGHVDVIPAQSFLIGGGIIECGAVGEHEGVVVAGLGVFVGDALEGGGLGPFLANQLALVEGELAVGVLLCKNGLVVQLVAEHHAVHCVGLVEQLAHGLQVSALVAQMDVAEHVLLVNDDAVNDGDAFRGHQLSQVAVGKGEQVFLFLGGFLAFCL